MSSPLLSVGTLAATLRTARQGCGLSIAQLAQRGKVSPRLVSEFERGKRPQVSLDTAMRLLHLVNVSLTVNQHALPVSDEASRRERAELRRRTWSGEKTTLAKQQTPVAPASNVGRLTAVARASRLAGGLQNAYREASARQALKRAT